jgi:hypothetical protein
MRTEELLRARLSVIEKSIRWKNSQKEWKKCLRKLECIPEEMSCGIFWR